jgi:hypothetical protein
MSTSSDRSGRRAVAAATALFAVAAAVLSTGLAGDASAGAGRIGAGRIGADDGAAAPEPPAARRERATSNGWMQLRCWQHGRLLFDEGPLRLASDARRGSSLVAERRDGGSIVVTEAGSTACLLRPAAPPPSPALPR